MKREVQNGSSAPACLTHFKELLCQSLKKTEDWRYPLVNLVGAVLILLSLIAAWNLPAAIIETFWAAISVYGLMKKPGEWQPKLR